VDLNLRSRRWRWITASLGVLGLLILVVLVLAQRSLNAGDATQLVAEDLSLLTPGSIARVEAAAKALNPTVACYWFARAAPYSPKAARRFAQLRCSPLASQAPTSPQQV
jgi:hypothetical protein